MMLVADRNSDGRHGGGRDRADRDSPTRWCALVARVPWAADFQGRLAKAQAIRDRLEGR